jgi:hypothetical protein
LKIIIQIKILCILIIIKNIIIFFKFITNKKLIINFIVDVEWIELFEQSENIFKKLKRNEMIIIKILKFFNIINLNYFLNFYTNKNIYIERCKLNSNIKSDLLVSIDFQIL